MILEINTDFAQLVTDPTLQTIDEQLTQINGVEYLFHYLWQPREACFYLSIFDQDENALARWMRLNILTNLLRRFPDPRLPQDGLLYCVDLSERGRAIEVPSDLGTRVPLLYVTLNELA